MDCESVQRHLIAIKIYADKAFDRLRNGDNFGIRDNIRLIECRLESIREEMYGIKDGIEPRKIGYYEDNS